MRSPAPGRVSCRPGGGAMVVSPGWSVSAPAPSAASTVVRFRAAGGASIFSAPQLDSGEHVIRLDTALRVRAVLSIVGPIGAGVGMGATLVWAPQSVPGGVPLPVVLFYALFTTGMVLSGIDVLVGRMTVVSATGI